MSVFERIFGKTYQYGTSDWRHQAMGELAQRRVTHTGQFGSPVRDEVGEFLSSNGWSHGTISWMIGRDYAGTGMIAVIYDKGRRIGIVHVDDKCTLSEARAVIAFAVKNGSYEKSV